MFVRVRLPVSAVKIVRCGPRDRHHETTVLYALQSDQAPGELFDLPGFSVNDEDLKTRIMVEVSMTGRNHQFVLVMLEARSASRSRRESDGHRSV